MPDELDRITHNPQVMGGRACIRGMRITVSMILRQLSAGVDRGKLLADFPLLEPEDIRQALQYGASLSEESIASAKTA